MVVVVTLVAFAASMASLQRPEAEAMAFAEHMCSVYRVTGDHKGDVMRGVESVWRGAAAVHAT